MERIKYFEQILISVNVILIFILRFFYIIDFITFIYRKIRRLYYFVKNLFIKKF